MNEPKDPEAAEPVQTESIKAVASAAICSELPAHQQEALMALYEAAGVGDTLAHKLSFWNRERPDTYISHNPTDQETVALHELSWIADRFPAEF